MASDHEKIAADAVAREARQAWWAALAELDRAALLAKIEAAKPAGWDILTDHNPASNALALMIVWQFAA